MTERNEYRRVTHEVRAGRLSPMKALDIAVTARLRGFEIPKLEAWAEARIRKVRERGGNPLLSQRMRS